MLREIFEWESCIFVVLCSSRHFDVAQNANKMIFPSSFFVFTVQVHLTDILFHSSKKVKTIIQNR